MSNPRPPLPAVPLPQVEAARRHGLELAAFPGVLSVRPGFRVVGGRLTDEPAVVVTVAKKLPPGELPSSAAVPARAGGVAVDVLQADPEELLAGPRGVDGWGWLLEPAAAEAAPEIGYRRPAELRLEPAKAAAVLCHVSPDTGWATLETFLGGTRERLTVAMYDFYAEHVVDAFAALGEEKKGVRLSLILQADDESEHQAVERLRQVWGDRLDYAPAVVTGARRVFATSYHTKVVVRDGEAFWISSGNFSRTSLPVVPDGSERTLYSLGNREWHAVVEDAALAATFEAFIRHDMRQAREALEKGAPEAAPALPDLLVPESALFVPEAAVEQPHPFAPERFQGVRVEPLMTPDNYTDAIVELIESAETSLYLQYSYIRVPKELDGFRRIVDAVTERIESGVDVRIIVGRNQKPADTQALQGKGWTLERFRYQTSKVHNKGILVDGRVAVVGSQNWSREGTQYNRDASLVFRSSDVAGYYTRVFLFDWEQLTRAPSLPPAEPVIAPPGATPAGMVRVPWKTWFED